jgi:hypothetical protein
MLGLRVCNSLRLLKMFAKIEVRRWPLRLRNLPEYCRSHGKLLTGCCCFFSAAMGMNIWQGGQRTRTSQVLARSQFSASQPNISRPAYLAWTCSNFDFVRVCRHWSRILWTLRAKRPASNHGSADVGVLTLQAFRLGAALDEGRYCSIEIVERTVVDPSAQRANASELGSTVGRPDHDHLHPHVARQ